MRYHFVGNLTFIALSVCGLAGAPASIAATAAGSLSVTALVLSTCTVVSTPVVFGGYSFAALDTSGNIVVTCTPDILSYNVALGAGAGTGATTSSRKLTTTTLGGADTLDYALYQDSGRTQNWGDVPGDTVASSTAPAGVIKNFPVYGRLGANQVGAVGLYSDTVQITVNY